MRYTEHDCQDPWFDPDNAATHATEFRAFRERYPRRIQATPEQTAQADARKLLLDDPKLESDRGRAARVLLWLMEQDKAIRLISVG